MIEIERTCADQFGLALANTTDPTVVIIPIKAYAEMQAASQAAFASAAMVYMAVSLIIGLVVGAGVTWYVLHHQEPVDVDEEE